MGIQDVHSNDTMLLKIDTLEDGMIGTTPNNFSGRHNQLMSINGSQGGGQTNLLIQEGMNQEAEAE